MKNGQIISSCPLLFLLFNIIYVMRNLNIENDHLNMTDYFASNTKIAPLFAISLVGTLSLPMM